MLKKISIGLVVLIAGFLIVASLQPDTFRLARSTTIDAPPAVVFAQVNDFHEWTAWSPWEKLDPALQRTYEGAPAGEGAVYAWKGNSEVGQGRMTIVESRPNELVRIKLEFIEPFEATNTAEFTFTPQGEQTVVEWSMSGENNLMSKAMGLLMDFDAMVGKDFETGLADMKAVAESESKRG